MLACMAEKIHMLRGSQHSLQWYTIGLVVHGGRFILKDRVLSRLVMLCQLFIRR